MSSVVRVSAIVTFHLMEDGLSDSQLLRGVKPVDMLRQPVEDYR